MDHFIIFVALSPIIALILFLVFMIIEMAIIIKHDDPENFNLKAIMEANFPAVYKLILRLNNPAVRKFVHHGYRVTKLDNVIAIDEQQQKWICINNADMPVLDFSEIIDTELIDTEEYICVLIYTPNTSFPEIRIYTYDRAAAERLLNIVNDMCRSARKQ